MNLISAMTGDRRFEEAYSRQMKQKQIPMTELYDWLFSETAAQYAEKGREEGREKGLTAMVSTLRSLKVDPEEACRLIRANDAYRSVPEERIRTLWEAAGDDRA